MNSFITPTWVSKDVAVNWMNEIKLVGRFDRSWDDQWRNKPQGAQIGYTVQARIQQRWQEAPHLGRSPRESAPPK